MPSLNILGSYVVQTGQSLYYTDPDAAQGVITLGEFSIEPPGAGVPRPDTSLTILGSVGMVFNSASYVVGIEEVNSTSNGPSFVTIGHGGQYALGSAGQAVGYGGEAPFSNNGSFYVSAAQSAEGVQFADWSGKVNDLSGFDNTGVFTVRGHGAGGVQNARGHFFNSGTITVDGEGSFSTAAIIGYGATVTNSGTITADTTGLSIEEPSGFNIPPNMPDNRSYPAMTITNTGVITAPTAIFLPGASVVSAQHVENSGTLNGDIWAAGVSSVAGGANHGTVIHNTGAINGKIMLDGFGDDVYDGRGGTLSGGIVFTSGANGSDTLYLGNDGESARGVSNDALGDPIGAANLTVYGGSGADTIIGGLGVNYIDGGAGNDVLTGGGQVSTVAFASSASGVTVSLALTTAQDTGDGVKTLTNFQNILGSAHADTLTGDANANLINGGGGDDTLTGGLGADTFVVHQVAGAVTVTDFSAVQRDRLDVTGLGLHSLSDVLQHAATVGPNTVITVGPASITLDGVAMAALQPSDFLFTPTPNDFTGAALSDVVFRNVASGDWGFLTIGAGDAQGWHPLGLSNTAYSVVGTGDFNGAGRSDVVFRNSVSGDWGYLTIGAGDAQGWHPLGISNPAYSVAGVGDFNGDHRSDVLFRNNASGDWGYLSFGANDAQGWRPLGVSAAAYSVVGVGDINGDGISDVVFRNNASGDWGYLDLSGSTQAWHELGISNTAYSVAGVGDVSGDGRSDVLFRNPVSGDWGYLTVGPGDAQGWHDLGISNTAYSVAGLGEYGDGGAADIMFRNNATGDWGYLSLGADDAQGWHPLGGSTVGYFVV
jgi:hypothetical protein